MQIFNSLLLLLTLFARFSVATRPEVMTANVNDSNENLFVMILNQGSHEELETFLYDQSSTGRQNEFLDRSFDFAYGWRNAELCRFLRQSFGPAAALSWASKSATESDRDAKINFILRS